jgi:hypothetical protein
MNSVSRQHQVANSGTVVLTSGNVKKNKCGIPNYDGQGNTNGKSQTHRTSNNCPNKQNANIQTNVDEQVETCPTPNCKGVGHSRNPNYSTHSSPKLCPLLRQNSDNLVDSEDELSWPRY